MPEAPSTNGRPLAEAPASAEPSALDRVRGTAGRVLGRLPASWQVRLSGEPPVTVAGQTLDPTLQMLLALEPREGETPLTSGTPDAARARFRRDVLAVAGRPTPVGLVRDLEVDGAAGPLPARRYSPADAEPGWPVTVYLHGGGFEIGDLDTADEPCRLLCRHGRQHVLSVAYRLAPEHPAPAAIEDATAALRWAQANAGQFGTSADRVAVGGDSAGANLSAVVAQETADDAPPLAQLLIYPPTDRTQPYPSGDLFDGFFLTAADRDAFHRLYTEGTSLSRDHPRISPLLGVRGGLAPALVAVAGFDVLRDEAEAYADALGAAGVRVEVERAPTLGHGFVHLTSVSAAPYRATVSLAARWRRLLDTL
jgi:acetyl esterase